MNVTASRPDTVRTFPLNKGLGVLFLSARILSEAKERSD